MADNKELSIQINGLLINNLGSQLYQNRPANVISEMLSNSWDADADNLHINIEKDYISISDDGKGMDYKTLSTVYMVLGKTTRDLANLKKKTPKGRNYTSRKGVGKLAAFGIAKTYDVITFRTNNGKKQYYWFKMDYNAIVKLENISSYKPTMIVNGESSINKQILKDNDIESQVKDFIEKTKDKGTLIVLTNLKLIKSINTDQLEKSLSKRFLFLSSDEMKIYINTKKYDHSKYLDVFDFRIPEEGKFTTEMIGENEIRYWIGFTKNAGLSTDSGGIGIYSHGKICQDRPFYFNTKGNEIWQRYMYGVIEADWIDEQNDDLIGPDRISIDWQDKDTDLLHKEGKKIVTHAITKFKEFKKTKATKELRKITSEMQFNVSPAEKEAIIDLISPVICEMSSSEMKKTFEITLDAWTNEPMKKLIKEAWGSLSKDDVDINNFIEILNKYAVPESLSIAVSCAERINAINKLTDYKDKKEADMHKILKEFPWIISPEYESYQHSIEFFSDQTLTTVSKEINKTSSNATVQDDKRPDLLFISSDRKKILIVELKSPKNDLEFDNYIQLQYYMNYMKQHHGNIQVTGMLIGRNTSAIKNSDTTIIIKEWDEQCTEVKQRYSYIISSILNQTGLGTESKDRRVTAMNDFLDKKTIDFIKNLLPPEKEK